MDKEALRIEQVYGEEILDSRGNPTVRATVVLKGGAVGCASVPSGASTGSYEAHELRDRDSKRYGGRGVLSAVGHVNREIAAAVTGISADEFRAVDAAMKKIDGTDNKTALGANAILGVSLATVRAAATQYGVPLWRYLGGTAVDRLPVPMMNILNGGAHAANNIDVQEFMILPLGVPDFSAALRAGSEIYHALGTLLRQRGLSTAVGDEGGFAPDLSGEEEALEQIMEAVTVAGYERDQIALAMDAAASEWQAKDQYFLPKSKKKCTADELIDHWQDLFERYPLLSLEDGLGENDFDGWRRMKEKMPGRMLVGDDLFVTNERRLRRGIAAGAGNAILIKPNQIGTVSETMDVIAVAKANGYRVILSHRSGETEDTSIADLAVGLGADFIKSGAPCRSERVAKYNRLLAIQRELRSFRYAGADVVFPLRNSKDGEKEKTPPEETGAFSLQNTAAYL